MWRNLFERCGRHSTSDLASVFRTVYGHHPLAEEESKLSNLRAEFENEASCFRLVLGHFNHQCRPTGFSVRFEKRDISYCQVSEGFSLALDTADNSVSAPILSGHPYEPHVVSFFKQTIRPDMVVVDVGANVGFHTMLTAKLVGPFGKVLCFEPNSENCRLILLGIEENQFSHVVVYPVAASDHQGHALFTTHIGSNGGFLPSTKDTLLSPNCIVVPTFRLDDLIMERVDLLKVDTEGAEGLVMKGAKSLIEQYRPIIVSEFSMEMLPRVSRISGFEYLNYFQELGYDLFVLDRGGAGLQRIRNIGLFLDEYGEVTRIEDLAFLPR